jgi:hypothetical protein
MAGKGERQGLICWIILMISLASRGLQARDNLAYPGPEPGPAGASVMNEELTLTNSAITCKWSIRAKRLQLVSITNRHSGVTLPLQDSESFQLVLANGRTVRASELKIVRRPDIENVPPHPQAARLGERSGGRGLHLALATRDESIMVYWRIILHDNANYVRQYVSLTPKKAEPPLREIILTQLTDPRAKPAGIVDGSPVVVGDMFFACEHPLAKVQVPDSQRPEVRCSLPRMTSWKPGETQVYSSVMGVVPPGQLRRGFLYYVERERAQAYRPFLHYNSWYDIGYGPERILEPDALQVIDLFGKELSQRRKVVMDSFVMDDGWDDPATLWRFHEGFPKGFASLQRRAERYQSGIGAWLSPWGGYGKAKEQRLKYGLQEGFETNKNGFSMAGPKYYARFRDACLGMVRDYGLNYFKFDGISSGGAPTGAPAEFSADVEALLRLIGDLRAAKPDLFINVTTGTWSSPWWLWYADSTWRSGSDWSTCGWGGQRQQQVTYRDAQTWQNVVSRAPLYPINSLMTQGVMFANHGLPNDANGLTEDIRAFFASGTNCQELYLTPSLLDAKTWDVLAEAAKWSRENADVLVDTHWIGGDPAKGEVYGWASWCPRKGILALRNPKDAPGRLAIDIGKAFELPRGAAQRYSLKSPWASDAATAELTLSAGAEHTFEVKPFEVLVFDAAPL